MQTKTLSRSKLISFAVVLSIAVVMPLFIHIQPVTGPIVNALLFISVVFVGIEGAIAIALVPSLVAMSVGLLPAILAPMVPFIMVGNVILVIAFDYLRKKNFWYGMIAGSLLKFIFLYATSLIVIDVVIKKELAVKIVTMMSWPQLITALSGGVIAFVLLKIFRAKLD